jgi:hypothetical protein
MAPLRGRTSRCARSTRAPAMTSRASRSRCESSTPDTRPSTGLETIFEKRGVSIAEIGDRWRRSEPRSLLLRPSSGTTRAGGGPDKSGTAEPAGRERGGPDRLEATDGGKWSARCAALSIRRGTEIEARRVGLVAGRRLRPRHAAILGARRQGSGRSVSNRRCGKGERNTARPEIAALLRDRNAALLKDRFHYCHSASFEVARRRPS